MHSEEYKKLSVDDKEKINKITNTLSQEGLVLSDKEISNLVSCLNNDMTTEEVREGILNNINRANHGLDKINNYKGKNVK